MADPQPLGTQAATSQQATVPQQATTDDDTLVIKALQDLTVAVNGLIQTVKAAT